MHHNTVKTITKSLVLLFIILCTSIVVHGSITIEKTIYLTVGKSTSVSPWSEVNSAYSGFGCSMTKLMGISDNSVILVSTGTKYATKYPSLYHDTEYLDGYYYTYRVDAIKSGTSTINLHVSCTKREGFMPVNHIIGDFIVSYHVVVTEEPKVTYISIPEDLSLEVGDTYTFSPKIYEEGAKTTLNWYSSNPSIVSIDNNGQINAISPGNSIISCTASNGVTARCIVTVNSILISNLSINQSEIEIDEGEQYTLHPLIIPVNATNQEVEWESTNKNIAIVSNSGIVIGIADGICFINVYSKDGSNKRSSCIVHVNKKIVNVETVTLPYNNINLVVGDTITLIASVSPQNATNKSLRWLSSDTSIVTINDNGQITAKSCGQATITACSMDNSNAYASCNIIVEASAIPIVSLIMQGIVCKVGDSVEISAVVEPENATDHVLNWSSSNPGVADVDTEGNVWFNAAGNATVTAECHGHEVSVPFVVKDVLASALNVFPVEAIGGVGYEFSLLALHEPENTTDKSVIWESSDPEVATVSEDGRVSLASMGSAQITARSGEKTAVCTVTVDDIVSLTEMALTGVVIDIVDGGIVVRNAPVGESIAVYSVDGKVINGAVVESDETRLNLAVGIYIVKVSPATVAKVLIK